MLTVLGGLGGGGGVGGEVLQRLRDEARRLVPGVNQV
jgi:hypothetical protein